ncbi:MAG: hypothetical protein OJF51_002015 [Nitrospira sp.]|jgi:hypothetical protein|nr:MAG: hypothetical protein OJF51_002015 [Nitrospira sp.]
MSVPETGKDLTCLLSFMKSSVFFHATTLVSCVYKPLVYGNTSSVNGAAGETDPRELLCHVRKYIYGLDSALPYRYFSTSPWLP